MATVVTGLRPIAAVAEEVGLSAAELHTYGPYKAKVSLAALARRADRPDGRVVLVTAVTPTSAGEEKTVTAIALAQALRAQGHRAIVCLRETSMGPVFGLKGGATGGGRCTVEPAEDINLHFTGDLHAVTSANNLLAAMLDDHIHRGREPRIDVRRPTFHRVLDVNDRALRRVAVGLGGVLGRKLADYVVIEAGFGADLGAEKFINISLSPDVRGRRQRLTLVEVGDH